MVWRQRAWPRPAASEERHRAFGKAVVCMIASGLLLTTNDAIVKWLTDSLPVGQIMFLRGLALVAILVAALWHAGRLSTLTVRDHRGQALRALAFVASTLCFMNALRFLPLADAVAITFVSPLFTTLLAIPLLGERVGWRRWAAVAAGFAGVLLIVQPTGAGVHWAAALPIGAALAVAYAEILTRRISATESSIGILAYTSLAVALTGLASLPFGWPLPSPAELGLLLLSALLMGAALYLHIEAFRLAEASSIAPYRYTALLSAALIGFLVWGQLPNALAWLGSAVVVASALYIWHRERRRLPD